MLTNEEFVALGVLFMSPAIWPAKHHGVMPQSTNATRLDPVKNPT